MKAIGIFISIAIAAFLNPDMTMATPKTRPSSFVAGHSWIFTQLEGRPVRTFTSEWAKHLVLVGFRRVTQGRPTFDHADTTALADAYYSAQVKLLADLDTDGNGQVSLSEVRAGQSSEEAVQPGFGQRLLSSFDLDKDGSISRPEIERKASWELQRFSRQMGSPFALMTLDIDGDGILTEDEIAAATEAVISYVDEDDDGLLSWGELCGATNTFIKSWGLRTCF